MTLGLRIRQEFAVLINIELGYAESTTAAPVLAIIRNASTLTRWAQFSPNTRMPDSLDGMQASEQFALQERDPELYALMAGTAVAELELAASQGTLADVAATPAERQAAANAERVAELVAAQVGGRPGYYRELPNGEQEYVPPQAGNTTAMFELEALDPLAAERERMQATVLPKGNGLSVEDAQWVNAEAARLASLNAMAGGQ